MKYIMVLAAFVLPLFAGTAQGEIYRYTDSGKWGHGKWGQENGVRHAELQK